MVNTHILSVNIQRYDIKYMIVGKNVGVCTKEEQTSSHIIIGTILGKKIKRNFSILNISTANPYKIDVLPIPILRIHLNGMHMRMNTI